MNAFDFKVHRIMDYVVVAFLLAIPTLLQLPPLFASCAYVLAGTYLVLVVPPLWRV